ncbi:MAG: hypothetical protein Q7T56_13705 [Nocardioidaceae bacterium]|nr:hypothetical protein [Nocardioidaceae bacterium]
MESRGTGVHSGRRRAGIVGALVVAVVVGALGLAAPASAQRPADRLAGRASDHSWLIEGARWDACRPITYAVNTRHLRADAAGKRAYVAEVRWAVRQIRLASGLQLRYRGTTTAVPQRGVANPAGVDVLIAWARPGRDSSWLTERRYLGYGGAEAVGHRLRNGFVVMNADVAHRYPSRRYRGDRRAWNRRITTLHELSHAIGAGHAHGRSQVMYPTLAGQAYRFGAGDATIMRTLGADRSACS